MVRQLHKDNHYVPQVYLKQWSVNGFIQTYRLLVPHDRVPPWKLHSLRGIAFHQHLYTYLAGGEETDEFERWLGSEFEHPAEAAIELAVTDRRMSSDHWKSLIRFAVAQDVRTPANLKAFLQRQKEILQPLLRETLEEVVSKLERRAAGEIVSFAQGMDSSELFPLRVSTKKASDGNAEIKAEAIVGRKMWLWSIRHLLTNTIAKISHRHWTIVQAPEGLSWPTTDNPVVKLNFFSASNYDFKAGWGSPRSDIFLPLGPRHLLHSTVGQRSWPRGTVLGAQEAGLIRKIIVEHADRYIFEKERSDIELVRPRLVSLVQYHEEQETWKNWHQQQSEVEFALPQRVR